MKPTVAIAMSGGVDSLVSACILKESGFPVFGLHFKTGFESPMGPVVRDKLSGLASQLGISIHIVDLSGAFRREVVDYFIRTYREGKTPNPCLVCNPNVKFGALLDVAKSKGADVLATGHYARIIHGEDGRYRLLRGLDQRKDQSYFLGFLSQRQLSQACFPLGEMTKDQTKAFAREKGLTPATQNESQDICFIQEKTYGDFLEKYAGMTPNPGSIVTKDGEIVGRHPGLHMFTIGQRRGINCPSSEPFYVLRLEMKTNTLVVGRKPDLSSASCVVGRLNWIDPPPDMPVTVDVRLRYRHRATPATVTHHGSEEVMVRFLSPQEAATPGQGAVFYRGDRVVGAGIISS
jgi:tRNA-specific 2-thiouridylase